MDLFSSMLFYLDKVFVDLLLGSATVLESVSPKIAFCSMVQKFRFYPVEETPVL